MISIKSYSYKESVHNLNFFNDKEQNYIFVTPNPILADALRSNLIISKDYSAEVITVSKLIQSQLSHAFGNEVLNHFVGKKEFLHLLSLVWKKTHSAKDFDLFYQCFEIGRAHV